jgi:hypothetical protein
MTTVVGNLEVPLSLPLLFSSNRRRADRDADIDPDPPRTSVRAARAVTAKPKPKPQAQIKEEEDGGDALVSSIDGAGIDESDDRSIDADDSKQSSRRSSTVKIGKTQPPSASSAASRSGSAASAGAKRPAATTGSRRGSDAFGSAKSPRDSAEAGSGGDSARTSRMSPRAAGGRGSMRGDFHQSSGSYGGGGSGAGADEEDNAQDAAEKRRIAQRLKRQQQILAAREASGMTEMRRSANARATEQLSGARRDELEQQVENLKSELAVKEKQVQDLLDKRTEGAQWVTLLPSLLFLSCIYLCDLFDADLSRCLVIAQKQYQDTLQQNRQLKALLADYEGQEDKEKSLQTALDAQTEEVER